MRRLLLLPLIVLAGCGGADRPAAPSGESVVRAWSDANRRGDVDAATKLFAVPAVVANGGPEASLTSVAAIRAFNRSLPCGSTVREVVPHHGVLIVTFVLTELPGGQCGSGVGGTVRAAFEVRDGRIVRWLRMDVDPRDAEPRVEV